MSAARDAVIEATDPPSATAGFAHDFMTDQTDDELCCVCGKPITDSVIYTTTDLSFRWHVRCDKDWLKHQRAQAFVRTIAAQAEREAKV